MADRSFLAVEEIIPSRDAENFMIGRVDLPLQRIWSQVSEDRVSDSTV